MTELIYLQDSYKKEFEAKVIKAEGKNIFLDKTCFYPASGGQPTDTGLIVADGREFRVVSVRKIGLDVAHEIDFEGIKAGAEITGLVDWSRRYRLMRGHTACHILSSVVNRETGALITGNQIAEDRCRVDFDLENFDRKLIRSFEEKANQIIKENVPLEIKTLPKDEAFQIPAVLKLKNVLPPSVENIRVVSIGNYDAQACGGTHVNNTEEIKGIQLTKAENKGKNNRRIYFVLRD